MSYPIQFVLILDVDDQISDDEVLHLLPKERYGIETFRLSDFDSPHASRRGIERSPFDWDGLCLAIYRMISHVRTTSGNSTKPCEFYIVGRAPLPLFVHLGKEISAWKDSITFLNRRKDGSWDVLGFKTQPSGNSQKFFTQINGLKASRATGRVAVFASTLGQCIQHDLVRDFIRGQGDELAGVLEVRTEQFKFLDQQNFGTAGSELTQLFSQLVGTYPDMSGIALFVAGPAPLAYLIGRALNPHMISDLWIPNFEAGQYHQAVSLPLSGMTKPLMSDSNEDKEARDRIFSVIKEEIKKISETLDDADFPEFMSREKKVSFKKKLNSLRIPDYPEGEDFTLQVLQGKMTIGHGLLEALRPFEESEIRVIGGLLLLHEIYHFDQNIQSTNYLGIGRAGTALEEIDFWADIVAINTQAWRILRLSKPSAKENPQNCIVTQIEGAIKGIQAFDRMEQGNRIHQLAERRLRRYLIWHLQLARAKTVRDSNQIQELLSKRLIVELAPMKGFLNNRNDKIVKEPLDNTELFVVLDGQLLRFSARPGFIPKELVEAVRVFDWSETERAMNFIVGENHSLLVPWAT